MQTRYHDAINAQGGACNPIALVNALQRRITEYVADNGHDMTAIRNDAAFRLIVHQIAFLFNCGELDELLTGEYELAMCKCNDAIREQPNERNQLDYHLDND